MCTIRRESDCVGVIVGGDITHFVFVWLFCILVCLYLVCVL
jgi:hypothetical protein